MLGYKFRSDEEQDALEFMPNSPYASDDQPYLSVARYSLVGFEPREVDKKALVDNHGTQDNVWWTDYNRQADRAVNLGQL